MEQFYIDFLSIVNSSIHSLRPNVSPDFDYNRAFKLFSTGKLINITYKTVSAIENAENLPEQLLLRWKTSCFSASLRQMAFIFELKKVLQLAEENDIHPVLFKGIALAQLYPEPFARSSSDVDLLIDEDDQAKMGDLLTSIGYSLVEGASKDHVPVYSINEGNRILKIEVHDKLWENYKGKLIDSLIALDLTNKSTLIHLNVQGLDITTLGYKEHLIYQIFHIAKHFSVEGLPMRYLCDLVLYIDAYQDKIDWNSFWVAMDKTGYTLFCKSVFAICNKYLGMKYDYYNDDSALEINESFLMDIILTGRSDKDMTEKYAANAMLASYMVREQHSYTSTIFKKKKIYFPSHKELNDHYMYAKKIPILLPIAWVHRYISAIKYTMLCKEKGFSSIEVLKKFEHRIELMNELGLIDQK